MDDTCQNVRLTSVVAVERLVLPWILFGQFVHDDTRQRDHFIAAVTSTVDDNTTFNTSIQHSLHLRSLSRTVVSSHGIFIVQWWRPRSVGTCLRSVGWNLKTIPERFVIRTWYQISTQSNYTNVSRSYNLTVGFENHSHSYKRTKLLRGGKEDPTGTLYIGDGAWGVIPYEAGNMWYLASSAKKRNFIHVNVGQTNMTLQSVDETGQIFDAVTVY